MNSQPSESVTVTIQRVLIANRGEIAVRIMRACSGLGIETVAVYSSADATSLHVRQADHSEDLGDGPASNNYLNTEKIIAAALQSGAQAIHPGYGFLSENAGFAEAVAEAGLIFIGPPAPAIEIMGEKVASRAAAIDAQVPLAPGSQGAVQSPDEVLVFGEQHGYPLLIKASFGGGGRGMRRVVTSEDVAEAYEAAVREATGAFGRGDVYVERYLENARHVEIQVFADAHGHVVYYGDRDCSIQRRHQKLIEEAPAPGLSESLRQEMGEAAVRLARQVDYRGAGTVEFLVEGGRFYFLEMNTRIQVEHPVTEQITGIDLVQEQIRVAAGLPLSHPESISPTGAVAIEVRINAEDASAGEFLPSPGRIETVAIPTSATVRWDAGYESGDAVLPHYDSLIGKLVVTADTRDAAIERMLVALGELVIEGVPTTAGVAAAIINDSAFRGVSFSTRWLEDSFDWSTADLRSRHEVEVGGRMYLIPVFSDSPPQAGTDRESSSASAGPKMSRRATGSKPQKNGAGSHELVAPMQGTIVRCNVAVGDRVTAGDALFILEAMKMENPIVAGQDGVIRSISVEVGSTVAAGAVVAEFAAEEAT